MNDNWKLKELFHFDSKHWHILNDTDQTILVKNPNGQDHELKPESKVEFKSDNYSIILPNNRIIRYSDKRYVDDPDFYKNHNIIIQRLARRLKEGHVIDGLDFLDYHYKWTKQKSKFLTFIKHFVIPISWASDSKNDFEIYANAIKDWVEEKRKLKKRPAQILLLVIPVIIFSVGVIFSNDFKEIFIGALIGGLATSLKEVYDLLTD